MATENVGYLAAFGGGVVSFLSPCVLPIVPASVITGLDVAEMRSGAARHLPRIAWTVLKRLYGVDLELQWLAPSA